MHLRASIPAAALALLAGGLGTFATSPTSAAEPSARPVPAATSTVAKQAGKGPDCGTKRFRKPGGGYWRCSFADDFDGGRLNRKKWRVVTTANSDFRIGPECYRDDPSVIAVSSGVLKLTARSTEPRTCTSPRTGSFTSSYLGSSITTKDRFMQTYGRFVARVKFPKIKTQGTHSAFWLTPDNPARYGAVWPMSGEIDIAEFYSKHPDRIIPFIHYVPDQLVWDEVTNEYCKVKRLSKRWHKLKLTWTETTLTINYDSKRCLRMAWRSGPYTVKPAPFNAPFIVNLTQGLGVAQNAFVEGGTPLPATMRVDWVRVWK